MARTAIASTASPVKTVVVRAYDLDIICGPDEDDTRSSEQKKNSLRIRRSRTLDAKEEDNTLPGPQHQDILNAADDRTLAGRAADGDAPAFEVLVRRYAPLMRAYAARMLPSNDEVDDVVQDAFITAWQQLPSLDDGSHIKSWLMRIVSHKSIDRIRANRSHADIDMLDSPIPESSTPPRIAEAHSRIEALSEALSELPEQQRQCWVLKELAEYSYDEIAEALDLPLSTIRGLLARARKNLIPRMEEWR